DGPLQAGPVGLPSSCRLSWTSPCRPVSYRLASGKSVVCDRGPPMNDTVLISGASIAGPSLAYWLNRCGFRPTVVEKASTVRPGGYPIDLRGIAVEVIEWMGLLAQVRVIRRSVCFG